MKTKNWALLLFLIFTLFASYSFASVYDKCSENKHFLKGVELFNANQVSDSINEFTLALKEEGNCERVYRWRGGAFQKMGNHKEAIKDYTAGYKMDPSLKIHLYERANSYVALKEYSKANNDFRIVAECKYDKYKCFLTDEVIDDAEKKSEK